MVSVTFQFGVHITQCQTDGGSSTCNYSERNHWKGSKKAFSFQEIRRATSCSKVIFGMVDVGLVPSVGTSREIQAAIKVDCGLEIMGTEDHWGRNLGAEVIVEKVHR